MLPDALEGLRALRREHGVRTLLCEGGPSLNAELLAAGAIDELHLCLAALVAGGEDPLTIVEGGAIEPPRPLTLRSVHESGGYLFLRYRL